MPKRLLTPAAVAEHLADHDLFHVDGQPYTKVRAKNGVLQISDTGGASWREVDDVWAVRWTDAKGRRIALWRAAIVPALYKVADYAVYFMVFGLVAQLAYGYWVWKD